MLVQATVQVYDHCSQVRFHASALRRGWRPVPEEPAMWQREFPNGIHPIVAIRLARLSLSDLASRWAAVRLLYLNVEVVDEASLRHVCPDVALKGKWRPPWWCSCRVSCPAVAFRLPN